MDITHFNNTKVDTVVIGGGQAGIAMSEHLSALNISHLVLEKNRIAEAWRTRRWDSLVANGPAWHDKFPNMDFDEHQDAFINHNEVADYFERYAKKIDAPIHTDVEVFKAKRNESGPGFIVETSKGNIEAKRIVAATGAFQKAVIPKIANQDPNMFQIHSDSYKNPDQLPEGAVLVIGTGASGVQITDELNRAGKKVFLSVGSHERPPRRYRGRDNVWWMGVLGRWDIPEKSTQKHKAFVVSGAHGGKNVDFRELEEQGVTLVGRTKEFKDGKVFLENDLAKNIHESDKMYLEFLKDADDFVKQSGIELPEEPEAYTILPDPTCVTQPILEMDLNKENITIIIWASGFKQDYSWLEVDSFDDQGRPRQRLGISNEIGVYFIGLPYLTARGSSFIWGVWHDAKRIANHIDIQRQYLKYEGNSQNTILLSQYDDSSQNAAIHSEHKQSVLAS